MRIPTVKRTEQQRANIRAGIHAAKLPPRSIEHSRKIAAARAGIPIELLDEYRQMRSEVRSADMTAAETRASLLAIVARRQAVDAAEKKPHAAPS